MILIPIFNDWDSFKKLIFEIDQIIKDFNNFSFDCIVVNDASTIDQPNLSKPKTFYQIANFKYERK